MVAASAPAVSTQLPIHEQVCATKLNHIHKGIDHYPVPVVDLEGLQDEDPKVRASLVKKIFEAGKVGAFVVVNHGVDEKIIFNLRHAANSFFALPLEEKLKSKKIQVPGIIRPVGYQGQFQDLTQKAFIVQRREVFEIQGSPAEHRDLVPWPEAAPTLRLAMEAYAEEQGKLSRWIYEALAEGLGLSRDAFMNQIDHKIHQQIVACSYPTSYTSETGVNPSHLGFGAHSDYPVMNIVVEDEAGGVEVFHDDQWHTTTPIPEAFTYFLGDPIECMSNGIYHSMIHRVVAPTSVQRRFSCVSTFEPINKDETTFSPVPELVKESGQPAKYIPYNFGDRGRNLMFKRFDPDTMTKKFMVSDFSTIDITRNFSSKDGEFHVGSRPLGSITEGY